MAELHRRILRLSNRGRGRLGTARPGRARLGAAILALSLACTRIAAAEPAAPTPPPTAESLRALAEDLRAPGEGARNAAFASLSTLPESAIPAIEARFREMRREAVRGEDGYEILRAFAHAVGSNDASEPVDIAPGVPKVLSEGRSQARARMAERLALLRSLERLGSARAMVAMLTLFEHDFEAFRWEARHIVTRVGKAAGPALLRAAAKVGTSLEVWGKWGQRALGIDGPAAMIESQDEGALVEIVRAYAAVMHMGGMPLVADFVDDPREPLRRAAREAMEVYGQNGVWQLRRIMEQQLGRAPDLDASWRVTMRDLYAALDARRLAPMNEALDRALADFAAGRVEEAASALDALLARAPELPRRAEMAVTYAALGDARLRAERWDDARRAYDRALWLDGSNPNATEWRASRALAEAELAIAHGAPEEALLRAALASPVARERAETRLEGETPEPVAAAEEATLDRETLAFALAGLGVLLLGLPWLVRGARRFPDALRPFGAHALTAGRSLGARALAQGRALAAASGRAMGAALEKARERAEAERAARAERAQMEARRAELAVRAQMEPSARAATHPAAAASVPAVRERVAAREAAAPDRAPTAKRAAEPLTPAPRSDKRRKPARAVLPAELLFGAPAGRDPKPTRPLGPPMDPSLTTSPGTVSAIDTLPG